MHFAWFMHLFIILFLCLPSSGGEFRHRRSVKRIDDYDDLSLDEPSTVKTTTHDQLDDESDVDDHYADSEESSTTPLTTTTTSSSSSTTTKRTPITVSTVETTTSQSGSSSTSSIQRSVTIYIGDNGPYSWTTTLDPEEVAFYLAKANRERFWLKIFAITVAVGMSSLAAALITIHIVRKSKRYHGYHVPTNTPSNNIKV